MSYTKSEFTPNLISGPGLSQQNDVRILDPNPLGQIVPHEDLFIYASLKARQKSKTVLTENSLGKIELSNLIQQDISLTSPTSTQVIDREVLFKTKPVLTTDWTEIGGWKSSANKIYQDFEGFGITNIDIEIKSQVAPKIVIDFVDVRGATLFEQGSCSPYGLFFNLPYPIFELTLKGYYGKAVNYYLNLVKFNSKFNSETGNMECRAEFIGYTFAFLSDMIVSYVEASQNLKDQYNPQGILRQKYADTKKFYVNNGINIVGNGEQPWCDTPKNPNHCTTIMDLIGALKTFDDVQKSNIVGSPEYTELNDLVQLEKDYKDYANQVYNLINELNKDSNVKSSTSSSINSNTQPWKFCTTTNNGTTQEVVDGGTIYKYFNKTNNGLLLNSVNTILSRKIGKSNVYDSNIGITCLVDDPANFTDKKNLYSSKNLNTKPWMLGLLKPLGYPAVTGEEDFINSDPVLYPPGWSVSSTPVKEGLGLIDLGYIVDDINRELDLLNNPDNGIITLKRKEVIDGINAIISENIGFNPTIRNIFTVLLCNTDAFMEILKNVAVAAENYHKTENLTNYVSANGNEQIISGNNKYVYPWPTYLEKVHTPKTTSNGLANNQQGTKEVYPGNKFPNWPETIFVEDFIKALLVLKRQNDIQNNKTEGIPGYDNYAPINPLESQYWETTPSPIKYTDVEGKNDILKIIGERLFISLDHSFFQPIRLTEDSLLIPRIGVGNWNPIKNNQVGGGFLDQLAKVEAWNLANTLDNKDRLNGFINYSDSTTFIDDVFKQLNLSNNNNGGVFKIVTGNDIRKGSVISGGDDMGFNPNEQYCVFKSETNGIMIKKIDGNPSYVHPNPFKMDVNNLIKLIPPSRQSEFNNKKIQITNKTFSDSILKNYQNQFVSSTNNIDFSTTAFKAGATGFPKSLVGFDDNQKILSFDKPQLYSTLAITVGKNLIKDIDFSDWWLNGTLTDDSLAGSLTSNMGLVTYWSKFYAANPTNNYVSEISFLTIDGGRFSGLPEKQTDQIIYNNNLYDKIKGDVKTLSEVTIELEGSNSTNADVRPFYSIYAALSVGTPLVTTPLWLDNVNNFRKLTRGNGVVTLSEPDEAKNLAYLFLHSLKMTPNIVRVINNNGNFYHGSKNSSVIWSLKAFNTSSGVAKVPKAWLLTLGAQLWRWREFVGVDNNGRWKKPLTCIRCGTGDLPIGNGDPLVQPGWNSVDGGPRNNGNGKLDFRNDKTQYLTEIYGASPATTGYKYPSVFGPNYQALTDTSRGSSKTNGDGDYSKYIGFRYYNFYQEKTGKLSQYLNKEVGDTVVKEYSWPQTYIAPHHIPYISPATWDNISNGQGSAFVVLTDGKIGFQDYVTLMPNKRTVTGTNTNLDYNEDGTPISNNIYAHRSKEEDGNLGLIIQNLDDRVKDLIVNEFETWAIDEWKKTLLPIVDPVNFPPVGGTLTSSYSYLTGQKSPSSQQLPVTNLDDDIFTLALNSTSGLLYNYLLTQEYWILNSTPKIWYGYGDDTQLDTDKTNQFYDDGFVVSKSQFDQYLTTFLSEWNAAKTARLKELDDQNKNNNKTNGLEDTVTDDTDVKLSLYRTFKSLTDKWISSSTKGTMFFNIVNSANGSSCGYKSVPTTLASHFQYVNRVMGDIGNLAVIDINKLSVLKDNLKITLYQYLSDLLVDNEYLFFPLPTYVNLTGQGVKGEDLLDMFRPSLLDIKDISCGPLFLCMYVGGTSRQLKFKSSQNCPIDQNVLNNIADDGFSLTDLNAPEEILNPTNIKGSKSDGYTAFKVLYGVENQNHFKNIQLDQSEFSETAESLLVIDKISQQGGSDQSSKGQNLNSMYLTRSYTATIESMGNMMIQPMTYFDLAGVPMFSGAYLITEVRHNFKPNNASTTFKGVRQPRATIPIVTDAALAMKIDFKDVKGTPNGSIKNLATSSTSGNGTIPVVDPSHYPDISQDILKLFGNPVICTSQPKINSPYYRNSNGEYHGGLDIGFSNPDTKDVNGKGTSAKVISAYNGVVTNVGTDPKKEFGTPPNGGWIIVRYGDSDGTKPFSDGYYYFFVYGHCNANSNITVGKTVKIGDELGSAKWAAGSSTGLHLHLQVHRLTTTVWSTNGNIDPSVFLNKKDDCITNLNVPTPVVTAAQDGTNPETTSSSGDGDNSGTQSSVANIGTRLNTNNLGNI